MLLGLAVAVAVGRISARLYKLQRITVDDGFFLLALAALISGTTVLYFDIPYIYLQENVEAGLRPAPVDLIPQLLRDEKLQDAASTLLGVTITSVKFSFLMFFKSLLRQQRKLIIWWWCICISLIPTAAILMFSILISCPYFDERVFGLSPLSLSTFQNPLLIACSQMRDSCGPSPRERDSESERDFGCVHRCFP